MKLIGRREQEICRTVIRPVPVCRETFLDGREESYERNSGRVPQAVEKGFSPA